MGFPILVRCYLYIESGPWLQRCLGDMGGITKKRDPEGNLQYIHMYILIQFLNHLTLVIDAHTEMLCSRVTPHVERQTVSTSSIGGDSRH